MKARNKELEKENADTSNKYLRLYDENDKLQEVLQNLQYQLTSGTGAKDDIKFDLSSILAGGETKDTASLVRDMQLQHEQELGGLKILLKKSEKEVEQRQLEINHYKTMCTELAEKYDKSCKKDDQLATQVSHKEDEIRKYQDKVSDHEVRIGQLNLEKSNY